MGTTVEEESQESPALSAGRFDRRAGTLRTPCLTQARNTASTPSRSGAAMMAARFSASINVRQTVARKAV